MYKENDFPQILHLDQACFTSAWSEKSWKNSLSMEQYRCIVLEEEETIKGFLLISSAGDEGEVQKIGVLKEERGRAYGKMLLEKGFSYWKTRGIHSVFLEVRESNYSARRLYEKLEFGNIGIRKRYYKNPDENAVLYMKQL